MAAAQSRPVRLDVIAPLVEGLGMCTSCELVLSGAGVTDNQRQHALDEYPQEWQEETRRLTDWVHDLAERHGDEILIKVLDPRSPEGLLKSVRHRVRRYPTWLVEGRDRVVGWDREALDGAIEHALEAKGV
jgi:hypothetical protein